MAGSTGPRRRRREVLRSGLFISKAREIESSAPRLEAQLRSVESAISRAADAFAPIPGTTVRMVKTDPFPGAPRLSVLFTIDSDYACTLQYVELLEGPAPP